MALLNLAPVNLDIQGVRAGDANTRRFTLTADGIPWDLTGATITAQARLHANDATPALTAVIDVDNPTGGSFLLSWPGDAVTATLAGELTWAGVWDLQIDTGAAFPTTILAGRLVAQMDVTRE